MNLVVAGKMIKGIAFDLEGTILNLEEQHWQAHISVAKEIGLIINPKKTQTFIDIPHMIGGPDEVIMEEILALARKREVLKKNPPSIREMLLTDKSIYHKLIDQLDPEQFKPRPGFINFLRYLKDFHFPITVGTLTKANEVYTLLGKSGLAEYFCHNDLTFWEDVQHTKPDPAVYFSTAAKLHIWPTEQLVFEDSHNGIKAAKNAGSVPIAVPTTTQPDIVKRLINAGAVDVFPDWRDVHCSITMSLEKI